MEAGSNESVRKSLRDRRDFLKTATGAMQLDVGAIAEGDAADQARVS